MPYSHQRRTSSNSRSQSRSRLSTTARQLLPKAVRDELRMCCALRGFSSIRQGEGKTIKQQHDLLSDFFHGVRGKSPSQISMLTEGKLHYADLYDSPKQRNVTSRSSNRKGRSTNLSTRIFLKPTLSLDHSRLFFLGTDITFSDLEKKKHSGSTLLNGRQLVDMAKRGLKDYRKALAFTTDKWNIKKNEPIESGTTVDDVIEYVRRRMYLSIHVVTIDDDDDIEDADNDEVENEMMREMNKKKRKKSIPEKRTKDGTCIQPSIVKSNDSDSSIDEETIFKDTKENSNDDTDSSNDDDDKGKATNDDKMNNDGKTKNDAKKKSSNTDDSTLSDDDDNDNDELGGNESNSDDESLSDSSTYVPDTYIFHSFFAYCLWGPFASMENQLSLFLLGTYSTSYTSFINIIH